MDSTADRAIAIHIDRAISSYFEMVSELMYMRTMSMTDDGRYSLRERLDEIVDIDKAIAHELRELNDLI